MKTNMGAEKIFKLVIRLIERIKRNSKKKKSNGNIKNNSANEDIEKLHAITHIFLHGGWF